MPASTQVNRDACADLAWRRLLLASGGRELPEWPAVRAQISVCQVDRGGTLFLQDSVHPYVYAVRSGLFKLVYLDSNGTEWVKSFAEQGRFFASIAALEPGGRSSFMVNAIETSVVERLDYRVIEALASQHLAWSRAVHTLISTYAARKEQRERELLTLTPEARYRAFVELSPELAERIPQKDLARHLGVTPVGLNRIVSRVRRSTP